MQLTCRIQSFVLALTLLTLPLAVIAGAYACAPQECTKLCCAAHHGHSMNGMHMNCDGPSRSASLCIVRCNSQFSSDFSLIAPLPPTQLSAAVNLPVPELAAAAWLSNSPGISEGFSLLPFQPPRS